MSLTDVEKEDLLCENYLKMKRFLFCNGVRADDIEDLLQDVFIKAFRSIKNLKDIEKMDAWLRSISMNVIRAHYNKEHRHGYCAVAMDLESFEAEQLNMSPDEYGRLIDEIEAFAEKDAMEEVFSHLDEVTQMLFRLFYYEGYTIRDIAEMHRMNYNTMRSLHRRGLLKLRDLLLERRVGENEQNR